MSRRPLLALVLAAGLTLASFAVPARARVTYAEIMGCERGCEVAAAGFPLPFVADYPGLSVAHTVWWGGVLLGEDRVLPGPLAGSFAFWLAVSWLGVWLGGRAARRSRAG